MRYWHRMIAMVDDMCEAHGAQDCAQCPAREICSDFTGPEQDFEFEFIEREKT